MTKTRKNIKKGKNSTYSKKDSSKIRIGRYILMKKNN